MKDARTRLPTRAARLLAAAVIATAGCAGAGAGADEPRVEIEDAWARPAPGAVAEPAAPSNGGHASGHAAMAHGAGSNSAVYMTIRNTGGRDDRLVGVQGDAAVAIELHQSTLEDGIMRMRRVDAAPVPAGGELRLEPGGYHVMLIGLREPLLEGDTVILTLHLEQTGAVEVRAPVESRLPVR